MKTSLVITTINKLNQNIRNFSKNCKSKKWDFIVIGDSKSPKNYNLEYGNFFNINNQKKLKFKFAKICPNNHYARKNIGYLISASRKNEAIIETDDDNYPKKEFFKNIKFNQEVNKILNKSWINIYDLFTNKKEKVWPRGLPLDELFKNKIEITKKNKKKNYLLQQGVCENNPDVDAIYRLINKRINIKFKKYKIDLGNARTTFNSQNTIWHNSLLPLMYLPVTCTMRCTDIWRSLIVLKIFQINKMNILFFGTTMFQKRNQHNLMKDFEDEISLYLNCKNFYDVIDNLSLKKGNKYFEFNLKKIYLRLVEKNFFKKKELYFLNAWLKDCKKL